MKFYSDGDAEKVAENFFKYYYHDRGKKKWGGFFLSEHKKTLRDFRKEEKLGSQK